MRICGSRKWPVINPAEISVKIKVLFIFSSFFWQTDRAQKKRQIKLDGGNYIVKHCNNITAKKKLRFWRRKAGMKGSSDTQRRRQCKMIFKQVSTYTKLLSLVLKVRTEEMRLVPSFLFQLINWHVWCAINMLLRLLVLTITILHFWSNFFFF